MAQAQVSKSTVWDEIRAAYNTEFAAEGSVNLEGLAQAYGVNYGTLRNKSSQNNWKVEAQKLRDKVLEDTATTVVPMLVKHRVEVIDSHLRKLGSIRELALHRLQELVRSNKLTADQTLKVVFDSLRAERMLNEMIGDGLTHSMSDDDKEQALFQQFVQKFFADTSSGIKNVTPHVGPEAAPLLEAPAEQPVEILAPDAAVPETVNVASSKN